MHIAVNFSETSIGWLTAIWEDVVESSRIMVEMSFHFQSSVSLRDLVDFLTKGDILLQTTCVFWYFYFSVFKLFQCFYAISVFLCYFSVFMLFQCFYAISVFLCYFSVFMLFQCFYAISVFLCYFRVFGVFLLLMCFQVLFNSRDSNSRRLLLRS